ncbi:MAG: adenylosuccinate synthetase [Candidatus Eisenbacteria sp.]|nr:adenylosuccinate synthetase [Candidatus Eisenbacteria bacterium]
MNKQVDVVVGGQYGDEGKGQVALWLADNYPYDFYVRTGGENAEHRVRTKHEENFCYHIVPSATASDNADTAISILAPGMTFNPLSLAREWKGWGKLGREIWVDKHCAMITERLRKSGMDAATKRGSTHLGVGATMAAKVRRDGSCLLANDVAHLLKQLPGVILKDVTRALLKWGTGSILVEASQGTMLSLDHGYYPWCTSRNVTAMGALSDAGLSWRDVQNVVMVVTARPTRVPGNSGPSAGWELTWKQVCERAGRPLEVIRQTSGGSAGEEAGGIERPFEVSFEELQLASQLSGPTAIAVTHLDWLNMEDLGCQLPEQLSQVSLDFIARVENATKAPVILARTGPEYWDQIEFKGHRSHLHRGLL